MKLKKKYVIIESVILFSLLLLFACESLITDYKLDTDPDLLKDLTMLQYIEQGNDTTLSIYYEAVKYANIESIVSDDNQTRIVPTNNAFRTLFASIGIKSINELTPNLTKNLLSYLILPNKIKSIDLEENETLGVETLSKDSIFISRVPGAADPYRVYLNINGGFIPSYVPIIKQDFTFKDGVMHVVDEFPIFRKKIKDTDPAPADIDYTLAQKDTIWVLEDASVYQMKKTSNYGTSINQIVPRTYYNRFTYLKFRLKPINFIDDLAFAKLNIRVQRINGVDYTPLCGVFETSYDWNESTLIWNNKPDFGMEVSSAELSLDWNNLTITSSIKKLYEENTQYVSYALQALNGADIPSAAIFVYNKENTINSPAFIELMSTTPSELRLDVDIPVELKSYDGIAKLLKNDLSMSAEGTKYKYTDNNIIYVLVNPPKDGILTYFGLPMTKNSQFTQEALAVGAIKYIGNNLTPTDTFELKAQDYIGGAYQKLIRVEVK